MTFGVDISEMGQEGISIQRLKDEGAEFVIARLGGYGDYKDHSFDGIYDECKRVGMPIGAYWYADALTPERARYEAESCKRFLEGRQLEYPVWYDVEENPEHILMSVNQPGYLAQVIAAFCGSMEDAGWWCGLYSWPWLMRPCGSTIERFDRWCCDYTGTPPDIDWYGMWQFGGGTNPIRSPWMAGYVVDQNYSYRDYPALMVQHGRNGFDSGITEADLARLSEMVDGKLAALAEAVWSFRNPELEKVDAYQILRDARTATGTDDGQTLNGYCARYEDTGLGRIDTGSRA